MVAECSHLSQIRITSTKKRVCEDCVKTGDTSVHQRLYLECGHGETLDLRTILGTLLVLISVVLITTTRATKRVARLAVEDTG
jgi:hypothetical protein